MWPLFLPAVAINKTLRAKKAESSGMGSKVRLRGGARSCGSECGPGCELRDCFEGEDLSNRSPFTSESSRIRASVIRKKKRVGITTIVGIKNPTVPKFQYCFLIELAFELEKTLIQIRDLHAFWPLFLRVFRDSTA
jgi:hypothetical protein